MQRESFVRGPAKIVFDAGGGTPYSFQSKGGVQVKWNYSTFNIDTDLGGKTDERIADRLVEITFTPSGDMANMAQLFPLSNNGNFIGSSVFGPTDKILRIAGADGRKLEFTNAAITKMPELQLGATKTAFGPVTFTALGQENTDWATANSMFTEAALAWAAPAAETIITEPYAVAWGAAPWDAIETADGVRVSFNAQLQPVQTDKHGTVDYTYGTLEVSARFQPLGISLAQLTAKLDGIVQGVGAKRGKSIKTATDFVVTGTGLVCTLKKAALKNPSLQWGTVSPRIPEIELVATLGAVGDPLFIVAEP